MASPLGKTTFVQSTDICDISFDLAVVSSGPVQIMLRQSNAADEVGEDCGKGIVQIKSGSEWHTRSCSMSSELPFLSVQDVHLVIW